MVAACPNISNRVVRASRMFVASRSEGLSIQRQYRMPYIRQDGREEHGGHWVVNLVNRQDTFCSIVRCPREGMPVASNLDALRHHRQATRASPLRREARPMVPVLDAVRALAVSVAGQIQRQRSVRWQRRPGRPLACGRDAWRDACGTPALNSLRDDRRSTRQRPYGARTSRPQARNKHHKSHR